MHKCNFSLPLTEVQHSHFIQFMTYDPVFHFARTTPAISYYSFYFLSLFFLITCLYSSSLLLSLTAIQTFHSCYCSSNAFCNVFSISDSLPLFSGGPPQVLLKFRRGFCFFVLFCFCAPVVFVLSHKPVLTVFQWLAPRSCPFATTFSSDNSSTFHHSSSWFLLQSTTR